MRKLKIFCFFLFFCFIFFIFHNWFLASEIIGGDWPHIFEETFKNYSFYFSSWNPFMANGFGGVSPFYALGIFHGFTVFLSQIFYFSWPLAYKVSWFGLFISLSVFSSMYLFRVVLPQARFWQQIIAAIIFTTNTYILMVVSGGQMGVALAYSVAPIVLSRFIIIIQNSKFKIQNSFIAALALGMQVMFDPRIAYLTFIAIGIYIIFLILSFGFALKKIFLFFLSNVFFGLCLSIGFTVLLHAVWILPMLFIQLNTIPQELTNVAGFRFFSFATFSSAFSLLHPNWPENIFGKTYFLKPEFLLLPVFAFSSLLFLAKIKDIKLKTNIIFFALLGLLGAFLAKGVNAPFEQVNQWLFMYIPGMNFFRDPTKFFLLIVLSYSVLIPFSLLQISRIVSSVKYQVIIPATFLLFWIFLIRPAIFGELGGTFARTEVPPEYIKLKDFLYGQPEFFRTLWIPRQQRFAYYSLTDLPVEAGPLFNKTKITDIIKKLRTPGIEEYLSELGVRYIIVPYDPYGEIFVKDRKYDSVEYKQTIQQMGTIPWLKRIDGFGKIAVFETRMVNKSLFWLENKGTISYIINNPSQYNITITTDHPQKLIFSQNFHPAWQLLFGETIIPSNKTSEGLISFMLPAGNYQGEVLFSANKYYIFGRYISIVTIVLIVIFLLQNVGKKYTIRK